MTKSVKGKYHVDEIFSKFVDELSCEKISMLKQSFSEKSLVHIDHILPPEFWNQLKEEATFLSQEKGKRKKLVIEETSSTERKMITVGNSICRQHAELIPAIYDSKSFRNFLSLVADEEVHMCPLKDEQIAISLLEQKGDTHGWHWDDFSFGLVWLIESPEPSAGGFTQCVPNTSWNKKDPKVFETLVNNPIESHYFPSGGFYFFRSGTTLHRVHPLREDSKRLIVNMDWASSEDLKKNFSLDTTTEIYN